MTAPEDAANVCRTPVSSRQAAWFRDTIAQGAAPSVPASPFFRLGRNYSLSIRRSDGSSIGLSGFGFALNFDGLAYQLDAPTLDALNQRFVDLARQSGKPCFAGLSQPKA
jgi:hypothetical protein